MKRFVYNVIVAGYSVGLTFNRAEAEYWLAHATHKDKKIVSFPHEVVACS